MAKYEQKVIHFELDGKHHYFGSLQALWDNIGQDTLGQTYNQLRHRCRFQLTPDTPIENKEKKYIIRKGVLVTSTQKEPNKDQSKDGDKPKDL